MDEQKQLRLEQRWERYLSRNTHGQQRAIPSARRLRGEEKDLTDRLTKWRILAQKRKDRTLLSSPEEQGRVERELSSSSGSSGSSGDDSGDETVSTPAPQTSAPHSPTPMITNIPTLSPTVNNLVAPQSIAQSASGVNVNAAVIGGVFAGTFCLVFLAAGVFLLFRRRRPNPALATSATDIVGQRTLKHRIDSSEM